MFPVLSPCILIRSFRPLLFSSVIIFHLFNFCFVLFICVIDFPFILFSDCIIARYLGQVNRSSSLWFSGRDYVCFFVFLSLPFPSFRCPSPVLVCRVLFHCCSFHLSVLLSFRFYHFLLLLFFICSFFVSFFVYVCCHFPFILLFGCCVARFLD